MKQLTESIAALLGFQDQAEKHIHRAILRHPQRSEALSSAMAILLPTHGMGRYPDIYAAHCYELLERVALGNPKDTHLGSRAEVLALLTQGAHHKRDPELVYGAARALYAALLKQIYPGVDLDFPEPYEGAAATLEHELIHRLAEPSRRAFIKAWPRPGGPLFDDLKETYELQNVA